MRKGTQKRLATEIISLLLVVMLAAVGCGFISAGAESSPQQAYSSGIDSEQYDEYTDFNEHNDILINYFADYYADSVMLKSESIVEDDIHKTVVRMDILRENDISLFVPKELFAAEGVKTYIGKEYGFIVDTFAVEGSDALHSIVLLFDIDTKNSLIDTKDHLIITVSPVFQGEFAYITPQTEKILCAYPVSGVKYTDEHTAAIYVSACADTIVPVPVTASPAASTPESCMFSQINKYYLKNFKSLANLYNENHLNAFDEEYQVYEDKGAFFTQMDFSYSAHSYKEGEVSFGSVKDVVVNAVTTGVDVLRLVGKLPPANPVMTVISDMVGFIKSCFDLAGETVDRLESTEKVLTYVPDYTSAEEQINDKGYLTKDALIEVVSEGGEDLILTTGDNITVDYQVASSSPSWRTRYVLSLVMDAFAVTDEGTETITLSNSGYSDGLDFATMEENVELENGVESMLYLLPHGKQYNRIDPAYTGWYTFSTDINGGYSTKLIDETDGLNFKEVETVYDAPNNTYRAYLQAGNRYVWEIGYNDEGLGGVQTCKYMFDPQIMAVGNNTVSFNNSAAEYIQLKFEKNGFYTLSSPDGAVFHVYNESMQEIASGTEVRVENGNDETVYLSVTFAEPATKDVTIVCNKEKDIAFVTYTEEEIEGITAENDAPVVLPVPADRTGYVFVGWWNNSIYDGEAVTGETLSSIDQATVTLYAKWQPIEYDIIYNENGGTDIADGSYTVEDFVRLETDIVKDGYIFKGWYDNAEFTGEPIEHISEGSVGDRAFYAKWVKETYTVSLDENNDYIDQQSADLTLDGAAYAGQTIIVNYGEGYRLPVATTRGFVFEGWYSGNEQITDANGNSMRDYTFEQDLEVTAKWRRESYTIKLKMDENHTYWLVDGGLSESEATIEYTADLCPNCMVNKLRSKGNMVLFRDGYIYKWLTTNPNDETELACWAETSKDLQDGAEYVVYAYYIPEEYQLYFEQVSGEKNDYTFNAEIEYPVYPVEEGYQFNGWYDTMSGEKFDYELMPDLTPNAEGNGSKSVEPNISLIEYSITYQLNGGKFEGANDPLSQYNVESGKYTLPVPAYTDYRFDGWYENASFTGDPVTEITQGTVGDLTFYAKWTKVYNVTLYYNNTTKTLENIASGEKIELPTRSVVDPNNAKLYYDGTWTVYKGGTEVEHFAFGSITVWEFDQTADVTIKLSWTPKVYNINYYYKYRGFGLVEEYTYSKGATLTPPMQVTSDYNEFKGFYTDSNFNNKITVISPEEHGDINIYIKWDYWMCGLTVIGDPVKVTAAEYTEQEAIEFDFILPEKSTVDYCAFQSVRIDFEFELWEEEDGYQQFYLTDENGTILWYLEMQHVPGDKSGEHQFYSTSIYIDLPVWNTNNINIYSFRFGAWGKFQDDWWYDNVRINVYLSADAPIDVNMDNKFIWNG